MMDLAKWADNPVARLEWGLEPRSWKRKAKGQLLTWLPAGSYLLIFCFLSLAHGHRLLLSFFSAVLTTTIFLFHLALRPVPLALRRKNRIDFLLIGLNGNQLLKGSTGPLITALMLVVGLHLMAMFLCSLLFIAGGFAEFMIITFLNSCPVVALLLGTGIAPSMWVLTKSKIIRVLAIAGLIFGWLVQYWIIFLVVITGCGDPRGEVAVYTLFFIVLLLSVILPGYIIFWAWRKAVKRLSYDE